MFAAHTHEGHAAVPLPSADLTERTLNRPDDTTSGPQHDDLGTRAPSDVENPARQAGHDGRDAEIEIEADRAQTEPERRYPDGYGPL